MTKVIRAKFIFIMQNGHKLFKICLFYSYNIYDHGFPRVQLASFSYYFSNHCFPRVYTPDAAMGLRTGYFTFDLIIATAK